MKQNLLRGKPQTAPTRPGAPRARWLARALPLVLLVLLTLCLATPVSAQDPGGRGVTQIVAMFTRLAGLFIQAAYSLMFIVFAVGSVKRGLAAQIALQFGMAGRVSNELLNLLGGVVIFALGLLTLPLVNWIIGEVSGLYETSIQITVPSFSVP